MSNMLSMMCPCLLPIINPQLSNHIANIRSLPPLNFHRKRQGIFTSGTFEPVTITLNTSQSDWGPTIDSVLILPKSSGKGRSLLIRDIHGVQWSDPTIKIMGQGGDLLFQGNKDDGASSEDVTKLKTAIEYTRDNPAPSITDGTPEPRFKNVVEKTAYFGKRELEMKQREKKAKERKAKYVKEAGGLKYTALAMAKS
ncbi:hypothetical protein TrCOL_g11468 [Triparma columacea]|uniref:Uncharacterized protein n=1 Tax=Triparma columacea TaxID=722753 RepID=A0A9W7G8R1_9STRA|nr:hypothetical protein TrCOL_g11468 [Triparma columacea]